MRAALAALGLVAVLAGAVPAADLTYAPATVDRYFRLEWQVTRSAKGPAIEKYVHNQARQTAERMQLRIERLDAAGSVVGASSVWVVGTIPRDDRAYFRAAVPDAPSYRVVVVAFDWSCGTGGM
jgi:hypothetical protein